MNILASNTCAFVGMCFVAPVWVTAALLLQSAEWVKSGRFR